LSVQITVDAPTTSTAESRRTSAPRAAIRRAAIASDTVNSGSRPSGTSATITPVANVSAATTPVSRK
jgi:hypothetical protein